MADSYIVFKIYVMLINSIKKMQSSGEWSITLCYYIDSILYDMFLTTF